MKYSLLLFFTLCSMTLIAQKEDAIPKKDKKSVELLVPHLIKVATTEREKVELIYEWITSKIDYDYSKVESDKPLSNVEVNKVLSSKKAICGEYCNLMQAMLKEINIESEIVTGYVHTTLKDSMIIPIADTHAWIAIKIGNKWYLADPTWDAGYLGNIKTNHEEKFAKKNEKLETKFVKKIDKLNAKLKSETNSNQLVKLNKKIEGNVEKNKKAKKTLKEKEEGAKIFTGKIGFVSDPKKDWFLIPVDSFLLKHLPLNPMWQLKTDTIGIKLFAQGRDSIRKRIRKPSGSFFKYDEQLSMYSELDFLERLLWEAEIGNKYSKKNSQVKALNYYNYLSFLTTKKTQKVAPPKYKIHNYAELLYLVDTAKVHAKLAKKESKKNYNYFKKAYGKLYKADQKMEKLYSKSQTKLMSTHEKSIDKIKTRNEKLESLNEVLETKIEKLSNKVSEESFVNDTTTVKYLSDSLSVLVDLFKVQKIIWSRATDSTSLQPLVNSIMHSKFLFRIRNMYVEYQDYEISEYIEESDSLLKINKVIMNSIYLDSLPIEMMSKNMYDIVKNMAKFNKYSKLELAQMLAAGETLNVEIILANFNRVLLSHYIELTELNNKAIEHNLWMVKTLGSFEPYLKGMGKNIEAQEAAHEGRYDYYMKANETNFSRDENLYKLIEKACTKWKVEFKENSK